MQRPTTPQYFRLDRSESPVGAMMIVHDEDGRLRALDFVDYEARMRRLLRLRYGLEGRDFDLVPGAMPSLIRVALTAYFAGDLGALDVIPVATAGTLFQREVWAALRRIPAGTAISYAALAHRIGRPTAVRAVGLANGANPIGVVVPCHRVIGADASLTGYGGGLDRKRWLLTHEGVAFKPARAA